MVNPLEQFLSVEERSDGVYVKASREDKNSLQIDCIRSAIDNALVMNFDIEKFRDVVTRGRGVFERIGPPFEIYNQEVEKYFQVTVTAQKASLKINSGYLVTGKRPTEKVVLFFLKRKGIAHGIKLEQIKQIIAENKWDEFFDIAETIPPVDGQDAKIELLVAINPDFQPQIRTDGSVDYRDIKTFISVGKGQVIATKIPPTPGKPGINLNGEPIPAKPGNDHQLPNGKNTEISSDGNQLLASKTGIIYKEGGLVHITEMLNISGDVDFNVGNIKYSGDVLINGNVAPGFTVEADGCVHIKGDVESAQIISRNGRVIVEKGVFGKGDTVIKAKLGISFSFAQEATLDTGGLISFDKFILHCDCTCETMDGHGATASIMGGEVRAEKSITVKQIGTEKSSLTKIKLFDKNKAAIEEKIKELLILDKKLKTELEPVEKQIKTKMALLKKTDDVSAKSRDEVKKWADAYNLLNQKIKYVNQKIEELKNGLNVPKNYDGFVYVHGCIFPGTEFDLYDIKYTVNDKLTNKRLRIQNSSIQSEG